MSGTVSVPAFRSVVLVTTGAVPTTPYTVASGIDWRAEVPTTTILGGTAPAPTPSVTISASDASAGEPSDTGTLTVTRSVASASALTVMLSVSGTAAVDKDYSALPSSVTIAANQTSATVTVTPIDDSATESAETVVVTVATGTGYSVGATASATVTIADNDATPPGTLPAPWTAYSVGTVGLAGSASYAAGTDTWSLAGAGADIWGSVDAFQAVGQPISGDVTVIARVTGMTRTDNWAKAGVMIRAGTGANAAYGFAYVTPSKGVSFQQRLATGGTASRTTVGSISAPVWVRLARVGTRVTASRSNDGTTWTTIGSADIPLGSPAQVMLAVTARSTSKLCTATFTNVSVTPTGGG